MRKRVDGIKSLCNLIFSVMLLALTAQTASVSSPYILPWTTPRLQGKTVKCWGRAYEFKSTLLPSRVVSQNDNILAAPIRLVASVDGSVVEWKDISFESTGADQESVSFVTQAFSSKLSAKCVFTTEFDGTTRVDMSIIPVGEISIDSLDIVVPLKSTYASFFHHASVYPIHVWDWPKRRMNAGRLGAEGMKLPFVFHLWLGSDERGIQFFSESDEAWSPADPDCAITVTPGDKETILRMNLLSNYKLVGEWKWSFGFIATPVKPWPKDYYAMRYCHMGAYGIEKNRYSGKPADSAQPPYLDVLANMGVNYLGFHEHWSDEQSLPRPKDPEALRSLIAACKSKGIRLVPYTGCYMSTRSPEYRKEWDSLPIGDHYQYQRPDNKDICRIMCNATGYPDLVVRTFASAYVEYGFGGIYIDGLCTPLPCTNTLHGCGYQGKDGKVHPTMAIWRTRNAMKSLYRLVKEQPNPGILFSHTSSSVLLPVLSFSDFYVDGEHLLSMMKLGTSDYPEDIFRAEMYGHNFGIPATQLPIYGNRNEKERARTLALLYDVMMVFHPEHQIDIWRAFDSFGMVGVQWVPYWKTESMITSSNTDDIKISAYLKRKLGALFVVANLGQKEVTTTLTVKRAGLGIPANVKLRARDESARALDHPLAGDSLTITVKPGTFRMISFQVAKQ